MTDYQSYLNFFGVTPDDLKKLIRTALGQGGDYADLFFEYTLANEISLRDGQVNAAGTHIDYGVGIRVVCQERTGYAYAETTAMPEMEKAARTAAQIAVSGQGRAIVPAKNLLLEKKETRSQLKS